MGGGKDDGGSTDNTIRYAPYLEAAHSRLLDHEGSDTPTSSFIDVLNATLGQSPYGTYEDVELVNEFFGTGYVLSDFPSLWDMFGKFMAGLDLHDLWAQVYNDVVDGPEIASAVAAQGAVLQDEISTTVYPKFTAGMRDINAVQSTAFVIGKTIIQDGYVKAINKFQSDIRIHALDVSNQQLQWHLEWNRAVVTIYEQLFKTFYTLKMDFDRANLEYAAKDEMWDINLFENARAIIGAMSGSAATASGNEPSQAQKAVGGAMSGAAAGAMITPANPIVGGVVGGLLGLASSFL